MAFVRLGEDPIIKVSDHQGLAGLKVRADIVEHARFRVGGCRARSSASGEKRKTKDEQTENCCTWRLASHLAQLLASRCTRFRLCVEYLPMEFQGEMQVLVQIAPAVVARPQSELMRETLGS